MKTEGQHAMEQSVKTSGIGGHCIKWFRVETCKKTISSRSQVVLPSRKNCETEKQGV